jgi:carboxylate-amine ligase
MAVLTSSTTTRTSAAFDAVKPLTIGIEEEVMLVDGDSLQPAPRAAEVLAALGCDQRFKLELPAAQIELLTPPAASVGECVACLRSARRDLQRAAEGLGLRALSVAAHPFAAPIGPLNGGSRYGELRDEFGTVVEAQQVCGQHVHVAVGGADATIAVHDMLREHLPEIAALAAAAPFYGGGDTGLASVRPKILELLPRQGVPPVLGDMARFAEALDWGARCGAVPDARWWWWELRPHATFGTLELRVCDAQSTVTETAALAATIHALVAALRDRYLAGERDRPVASWRIDENRWSACRHGVTGTMADLRTGESEPTRKRLERRLRELAPYAEWLGCAPQLRDAGRLLADGAMPATHRRIVAAGGLPALVQWLCDRFADPRG